MQAIVEFAENVVNSNFLIHPVSPWGCFSKQNRNFVDNFTFCCFELGVSYAFEIYDRKAMLNKRKCLSFYFCLNEIADFL